MNALRKYVLLLLWAAAASAGCGAKDQAIARPAQQPQTKVGPVEQRGKGAHVTATLRLSQAAARRGDEVDVAVEMNIAPMWEIHSLNAQPAEVATRLELIVPKGISLGSEWSEPGTTRSMSASGQPVYIGKAVFKRLVLVEAITTGEHEITCRVGYQACNERQCLTPETVVLSVPFVVHE